MSELLAQLAEAGEVAARGGFTIDPDKAREKLRQYQLADPRRYVLLLVEAAVSCGASKLEFEIDSDDLHLRFDGATFSFEQLENIYGSLFASAGEVAVEELGRLRGLRQLAFALNSCMALNPRFCRVVSVEAASEGAEHVGVRLELRPDAADDVARINAGEEPELQPGNWIHVKDRFRPGLVVEFFRSIRGTLGEVTLIREHCRWSRTPIFVNGERISGASQFTAKHWTSLDVLDPASGERIGCAVLGLEQGESELSPVFGDAYAELLVNGVHLERVAVLGGLPGFAAIVDSARFGKDVSQTKLLRDAGFDAIMAAILAAQGRTIARLAERCAAGQAPSWAVETLLTWLSLEKLGGLRRELRENLAFAAVAEAPIWPVIGAANLSTRALIESEGPIRYATTEFEFAPVDVPFVLAFAVDDGRLRARTLDKLFPGKTDDYTAALAREHERQRNRLRFMSRKQPPELSKGYYMLREPIGRIAEQGPGAAIRGELGLRAVGQQRTWIRLVHDGCLLEELALDFPVPGLRVVVEGEFVANHGYDEAARDAGLAAALVATLAALLRMLTGLAAGGAVTAEATELRALILHYINECAASDYAIKFFEQCGFSRTQARRELTKLLGAGQIQVTPLWRLDEPAGERHPFAELPLFARAHRGPASLAELRERFTGGARLLWLEVGTGPLPLFDQDVLLLEQAERELLRGLIGPDALEPFAEQLDRLRRREAFLERPTAPLQLPHATIVRTPVRGEGLRGELGLREFGFAAVGEGDAPVRVYYCERTLCEQRLELPLPGLCAWVESDAFELTREFDGLAHPLSLRAPLLRALVGLVELEIGRAQREPEALRRCEWWLLAMIPNVVFASSGLAHAFLQLWKRSGRAQALVELDGLLALHERFPARDIDRAFGRLRGRHELPSREAVEGLLSRPTRRLSDAERELVELRRALLAPLERLVELPLLRKFTGRAVDGTSARVLTLASIYDRVAGGDTVAWVGESFRLDAMPQLEFDVLGLDDVEQRLLSDQLELHGLEAVGEWLQGRAKFERRRKISDIRVPRGGALTVVEVRGDGWRGELGVVRASPRNAQRSIIRVFTDNREAAVVDLPAKPLALVGALAFDELELTPRFDDVTDDERERVRRLVQGRADELIGDLIERFAKLPRKDRPLAAELVRHLLRDWPPGTGGYAARARSKRRSSLFRGLAELPVFAGARKPWSAAELAEARERGPIATIGFRGDLPLPDSPVVLLDADDVEPTLRTLFGETVDYYARLERERELQARKDKAPRLPSEPPIAALATKPINSERLEGWLWITATREQVKFGGDGRVVAEREVAAFIWCGGAITGSGLGIVDDWTRVVLSRSQERMLERSAVELWTELADQFAQLSADGPSRKGPERARFVALRDALAAVFHNLHGGFGKGRTSAAQARKRKRGNRFERLYDRTRELALLQLSNGRWISADVAARERPIELAALGLWTGPSAEELAHQRAVERREAERRRESEREEQRRREAERRRVAAEAREREAARRREAQRRAEQEAREREAAAAREREEKTREQQRRRRAGKREPAPPPPPEQLLLEAIREELRLVRADQRGLLSNRVLDSLAIGEPVRRGSLLRHMDGRTLLDPDHKLVRAVLDGYLDDPTLVSLLASVVYSYLNIVHAEIEDAHEAEFLQRHAAHVATAGADE